MKTQNKINISTQDEINYNAADAAGHERADMGKGKPKGKRIYSVYRIQDEVAYCQSRNAWGKIFDEAFPVNTLEPYAPPQPK